MHGSKSHSKSMAIRSRCSFRKVNGATRPGGALPGDPLGYQSRPASSRPHSSHSHVSTSDLRSCHLCMPAQISEDLAEQYRKSQSHLKMAVENAKDAHKKAREAVGVADQIRKELRLATEGVCRMPRGEVAKIDARLRRATSKVQQLQVRALELPSNWLQPSATAAPCRCCAAPRSSAVAT